MTTPNLTPYFLALWDAAEKALATRGCGDAWKHEESLMALEYAATPERIQALLKELSEATAEVRDLSGKLEITAMERDTAIIRTMGAEAGVTVLVEALRKTRSELFWCADQLKGLGRPGHPGDSVSQALLAAKIALDNLPTASQSFLVEIERLRGNQRTPGTSEVCNHCRSHLFDARKRLAAGHCPDFCPIRPAKEPQA